MGSPISLREPSQSTPEYYAKVQNVDPEAYRVLCVIQCKMHVLKVQSSRLWIIYQVDA